MIARHCAGFRRFSRGLNAASRINAERPIRSPTVPAGPSAGNRPLASAAPPCTLIIPSTAAGTGGNGGFVRVGIIRRCSRPIGSADTSADEGNYSPPEAACFALALEGLLLFALRRMIYRPDLPQSLTLL